MSEEDLRSVLSQIALLRKQGDGMMKLDKRELAGKFWEQALAKAERCASRLTAQDPADDSAELLGVQGGLLKRLGQDARALQSYRQGATIEKNAGLGSTYNRMNAIRTGLLLKDTTIGRLAPALEELSTVMEERLAKPEASSEGWLLADLGDVCTLLGKTAEAEKNYRAYVRIAGGEEIRMTRETLALLLARVTEAMDPDTARVAAGLEALNRAISAGS